MRGLRWLLVIVIVLGGLVVVADRVGVWIAERTVADKIAAELASNDVDSAPPEVDVEGVPFLTQVTSGRYERVTVELRQIDSSEVRLREVTLVATGVTAAASALMSGDGAIDAERVDGTAMIGYADLAELTGIDDLELGPGEGGAMRVRLLTELAGEPVTLIGAAEASTADNTVQIRVEDLTVEDPPSGLPPGTEPVVRDLALQLSLDVQLPDLPYGLTVESVRAEADGVVVSVTASDVPLAR